MLRGMSPAAIIQSISGTRLAHETAIVYARLGRLLDRLAGQVQLPRHAVLPEIALKILCAHASGEQNNEARVLQYLRDGGREHPNIVKLHDCFEINGPNGTHTFLVPPFLGPSLSDWDIADRLSAATRYQQPTLVARHSYGLLPPELCFGYSPSVKSDVWALACVLFYIISTKYLFATFFPIYEMLIGMAVPIVGPLPPHWRGRVDHEKYGYREDGELKNRNDPDWWWDKDIQNDTVHGKVETFAFEGFSAKQREPLLKLLEEMLTFDPDKRLSAAEVAQRLTSPP
ncbi:hypothetical protein VMCG_09011 [Cytospora schulzeri]|uniref:Protein kinase domain-containing protein n=1 Tax=Cytospora schulzeri TaxID=448051 RepID=A0A423VPL1_9PEZI|nr:hypothetical protein VMCG_09011 [Valsa malicola]